jgi:hypothetical protein
LLREQPAHAVVFVHHNVEPDNAALKDSTDLMKLLRPRKQVKAVFFGHTHTWRRWEDDGIHMVNLPAVAYSFQAGAPLGWVRAMPSAKGLAIELRSLDGKHADHGKTIELTWRGTEERVRGF